MDFIAALILEHIKEIGVGRVFVKIVTWVSHKQKPFARFQMITLQLIKEKKIRCGDTMLKSVETRFVSSHGMTERVMHQKKVYKALVKDELFLQWLRKQSKPIRQEVHSVVIAQYYCVITKQKYCA